MWVSDCFKIIGMFRGHVWLVKWQGAVHGFLLQVDVSETYSEYRSVRGGCIGDSIYKIERYNDA